MAELLIVLGASVREACELNKHELRIAPVVLTSRVTLVSE